MTSNKFSCSFWPAQVFHHTLYFLLTTSLDRSLTLWIPSTSPAQQGIYCLDQSLERVSSAHTAHLPCTPTQSKMKTRSSSAAWLQWLLAPPLLTLLSAAPQLDFGSGGQGAGTVAGQDSGQGEVQTDNKIFFGNNALNNVALGAAAGVGGLLVTQQIINNVNSDNSNNNCNCGPSRRRRQINLGAGSSSKATQQQPGPAAEPDTDQKLFGLFGGGGGCNCDAPASVEFGADCKVRAKYFNP